MVLADSFVPAGLAFYGRARPAIVQVTVKWNVPVVVCVSTESARQLTV